MRIFTDGACSGNPGPGGYAVVVEPFVLGDPVEFYFSGRKPFTTNNEMELMAAHEAMSIAAMLVEKPKDKLHKPYTVTIISDSQYVVKGCTGEWKPKTHKDHWEMVRSHIIYNPHIEFKFEWVKGHKGNKLNELADELAKLAIHTFIPSSI